MVGYRKKKIGYSSYSSPLLGGAGEACRSFSDNPPISASHRQKTANSVSANAVVKSLRKPPTCENPATLIAMARQRLGAAYGLSRPLRRVELARLVGLHPDFLARVEKGKMPVGGPVRVAIEMLLAGNRSPLHESALQSRYGRRRP